VFCSKQSRPKM